MKKIKNLFSTPKKAVLSSIIIIAVLALLGTGTVYAAGTIAKSSAIGAENALHFAYADAGVDPASAENIQAEFDYEMGQFVYEINFSSNGSQYEYLVKSSDGTILKKENHIQFSKDVTTDKAEETFPDIEQIKNIALTDANLSASDVTFTKQKLEYEDGIRIYDLEFFTSESEYEYELYADTGRIYSKSIETIKSSESISKDNEVKADNVSDTNTSEQKSAEPSVTKAPGKKPSDSSVTKAPEKKPDDSSVTKAPEKKPDDSSVTKAPEKKPDDSSVTKAPEKKPTDVPQNTSRPGDSQIGLEKAKLIALNDAGLSASDVTFIRGELDYDDRHQVYDIEFITSKHEYEYEIDAITGDIHDKSVEKIEHPEKEAKPTHITDITESPEKDSYIGISKAKAIAVERAGLSVSEVVFEKVKRERDDGQIVYEVEFYYNNTEYECTIDAYTGSILEYDYDIDD